MRRHIHALIRALRTDHRTYYCAPCGGYYPFQHFCQ